jgi:hypothetical protein
MNDTLLVALASWVINDGNFVDFRRGDSVSFAIDVSAPIALVAVEAKNAQTPMFENAEGNLYRDFNANSEILATKRIGVHLQEAFPWRMRLGIPQKSWHDMGSA